MTNEYADRIGVNELQILADNFPIPCWIASAKGGIFWFNRRWHEYCGSTPSEMANGGWQSVHHPVALSEILSLWETAFAGKQPFETTMQLKGSDGCYRPFLTKVEPAVDTSGKVVRWIGVHTDISAQWEAEEKLKVIYEAEQQRTVYREAILSQLAEGIILTDAEGRILFVNQAANDLHGVTKLDVAPDEYAESYSLFTEGGEPHPSMDLPLARAVTREETVIGARWRIRRPNGDEVLAIGNAQPVYAADGEKLGAVLTIRDDTARHAAEKSLAEALAIKDALLIEVNHRVKNSLQIVTSLLMMQAQRSASPELKQKLKDACGRVEVVTRLHHHLYQNEGHNKVNLGRYVRDFVTDTVSAFSEGDAVDIQFIELSDVEVEMDRAISLALIVGELLTNALKYAFSNEGGNELVITVSSSDQKIQIDLSDNGVGLPQGFDVHTSDGFGMKIVNSLLKQLSASLVLIPQQRGTMFRLTFPKLV